MALYEAALVNALAQHVIPRLPDVTQIPEASWDGWEHIFTELQVDRSNEQQVKDTIQQCQTMLGSLLQAALMSGQQQQPGAEVPGVPPLAGQVTPEVAQQQTAIAPPSASATQGTEGPITASQLQLTQLVGSAGDQQVLLSQPKAHITARARMPRGDRLELWYQLAFEGYPESEAEWFPVHRIRAEYPHGDELITNFERGVGQSGQPDAQLPASIAPEGGSMQLPEPVSLAMPAADVSAVNGDASGMQQIMQANIPQQMDTAAGQHIDAAAAGHKRGRDDDATEEDPHKRQRTDETAVADAAAAGAVDPHAAAAAAAAEAAATSAGMAAQLGAGGQLFAMTGADGQPMLQVVPLQMPDAASLGQLGQMDMSQLTQLTGLDPQTLQALTLQGMQVGNMQQVLFQMPGAAAGQPMLAAGLQLAMPHQLQMHNAHHPGREHIIAHIKEGIKLLMHSSEELQRKKRQQLRRNELNQRRALLLPDGSAAPGSLATTAAGIPAPPAVRPTNMLQAIQAMPMAEKRAMLIAALRRALPVMMQTCQPMLGQHHPTGAELQAAGFGADGTDPLIQYQQLLAAQGQASMGGMQLIAVPLQGGMQTLMQMPLSAEQLQQMGSAVTLDANGQLQALQAGLSGMQMLDPAALASLGMLTQEQLQQLGLQAADPAVSAALDPTALQAAAAAAAAGLGVPGQDLGQGSAADAAAAAAMMAAQDPAALQSAAAAAAAAAVGTQPMAYDPATAAALQAAAAAALPADAAAGHQVDAAEAAAAAAPEGGVPAQIAQEAAAAAAADAARSAVAPAAAALDTAAPNEAILAADVLASLSRMHDPEDQADQPADPAAAAAASEAVSAAPAAVSVSDATTAAIMQSAAALPSTSAGPGLVLSDPAAAVVPVSAADINMAAFMSDPAALATFQQQHLVQLSGLEGFLQLPAHLAGMQHLLDQNQSLLDPSLATQDFTAAAHTQATATDGTG